MYARKLAALFAITLIIIATPTSADLLYDHFGVTLELGAAQTDTINGGTYTPFASGTFEPTRHTHTTDYVVDDWYGAWNPTGSGIDSGVGAGTYPSGDEPYDVEAIYFDNTETDLMIVIVTSFDPPPGRYEALAGASILTGDLALDLGLNDASADGFRYDYGVDICLDERPLNVLESADCASDTIGNDLYRTDNADWYASFGLHSAHAGGEHTNFDPNWTSFGGSYVGETTISYYEYDFGGGAQECRYPTYIIEATIPRSLLPAMAIEDSLGISWVEGCRNDGNSVQPILRFSDPPDIDTPEPGTLVLMGLGSLGMGWWKRRKKLAG